MRAVVLLAGLVTAAVVENDQDASLEHQVDNIDAYDAGLELFRLPEPNRSGCQPCSSHDMDYCIGEHLLQDHCCCDHNLPEKYPFIVHRCHMKDLPLCQPAAGDCEQYFRLDACCCQPYLRDHWQYHWWQAPRNQGAVAACLTMLPIATSILINAIR